MKITYIYYGNHYLFDTWTKSIGAKAYCFVPKILFNVQKRGKQNLLSKMWFNFIKGQPMLLQALAAIRSIAIPRADVYICENMACMLPAIIRKKKDSKIIVFNGDQFFLDYAKAKGLRKKYSDYFIRHVDGMVAISELYRDIAGKHIKVNQKMVYPYVDVKKYAGKKCDIKSKNICFTGYLVKLKAIDLLIEAYKKVDKKCKDKLYLIGAKIDNIPEMKSTKGVIVTGYVDDPSEYMKNCGVYVNPAWKEAFGINILEAMCMEMPVIVSDNCGAAEIVTKVDKRLVIKTDVDDIAKKIEWLNSNLKLKEQIGKRCRKEAVKYDEKRSTEGFKIAFKQLTEEIK